MLHYFYTFLFFLYFCVLTHPPSTLKLHPRKMLLATILPCSFLDSLILLYLITTQILYALNKINHAIYQMKKNQSNLLKSLNLIVSKITKKSYPFSVQIYKPFAGFSIDGHGTMDNACLTVKVECILKPKMEQKHLLNPQHSKSIQ